MAAVRRIEVGPRALVDEVARELEREPLDLRRQNIVTAAELPYQTAAGMRLDTGDYVAALDTARDMVDLAAVRDRQAAGEPDGRTPGKTTIQHGWPPYGLHKVSKNCDPVLGI